MGKNKRKIFYLMMHSVYFIYSYMPLDIGLRTTQVARNQLSHDRHHSCQLATRDLLYAPPNRQDSTYHSSYEALTGMTNSSKGLL